MHDPRIHKPKQNFHNIMILMVAIAFSEGCLNCLQNLSILSPKTHLPTHVLTHDGAFEWVLNHVNYQKWITEQTSTFLYFYGRSGSGKTALSTFLAKHFRIGQKVPDAVYFFFSKEDEVRGRPEAALLSLIYQLLIHRPSLFAQVEDMYVQLVRESPNWRVKDTWSLFRAILCCAGGPTTFIIDALNECECPEFLENLIKTHRDAKASYKFIVTSSRGPNFWEKPDFTIDLDAEEEARQGTELFRESKISDFIEEAPGYSGLKQQISNQLGHAEQSFLSVQLALGHLSNLKKLSTPLFVEQELRLLRGGIEKTYAHILEAVPQRIHQWAGKALLWILHSFRPLEIRELAIALAIETMPPQIDNDQLSRDLGADLADAFGPLIRIDNNRVHLVHPSMREFLLGKWLDEAAWYRPSIQPHLDIARASIAYLATKEIQENGPFVQLDEDGSPRLAIPEAREFGLLNYVGQYWPQHYRAVGWSVDTTGTEAAFHERVSHMLADADQLPVWFDLHKLLAYAKQPFATCLSNLSFLLASQLGFLEVIKIYLQSKDVSMQETVCLAMEIAAESGNGALMEILSQDSRADVGWTNKGGQTILHVAALNGSANVVERLLEKDGTDLAKVCSGSTALHLAAEGGSELVVKMLLNACADPNAEDSNGMVPLHLAAIKGHISVVEALLDGLALVDKRVQDGTEMTALHLAARSGKDIVARKLLERQATITTTWQGRTPLHIAAENGHKFVVRVILEFDPAFIDAQDNTGATALYLAAERGHTEVLKILLEQGKAKSDLKTEYERYTALHIAAKKGNTLVIKELVEHEADANAQDKSRQTPLHTAALTGKLESVEALLKIGANPDATDQSKHTPLHCAAMCGDLSVVRALLDGGAHQNATSSYGRTALHWAAWYGFSPIVKELIQRGTDLERKDRAEWTALHYAYSEIEATKELLEARADVDAINSEGSTPLLLASQDLCLQVMELLVNAKADPRIADNRKATPLHKVSQLGNLEAVQILIRAGGSPYATSNVDTTPEELAKGGDAKIIDALKVVDKTVVDNTEALALKCLNKEDLAGARDIREDLLKRAEEYLDAGDGLILGVMLNLASTYLESDNLEDAERLARRIINESESVPDDEKPINEREKASAVLDSVREKREKREQQAAPTCKPVEPETKPDEGENKLREPAPQLD